MIDLVKTRNSLAVALTLAIALLLLLAGVVPAQATSGDASISGTVSDSSSAPLGNIGVRLYDDVNGYVEQTLSLADGTYSFTDLPAAHYFLEFIENNSMEPYGTTWWHSGPSMDYTTGDPLDLTTNSVATDIDQTLYAASDVSATVTCATCVRAESTGGYANVSAQLQGRVPGSDVWTTEQTDAESASAANDQYDFVVSIPGEYRVRANFFGPEGYVSRTSAPFTVPEGRDGSDPVDAPSLALSHLRFFARTSSGTVYGYSFKGHDKLSSKAKVATGFKSYSTVVDPGDFDGDGIPDLLGIASNGTVTLYPGTASGGIGSKQPVATKLSGLSDIAAVGDWNGDGNTDLVGKTSTGTLYLEPGDGRGGFGAPITIGTTGAWKGYNLFASGDAFGHVSTYPSLIARSTSGNLYLFAGKYDGSLGAPEKIASGFSTSKTILAPGDLSGDNEPDLLVRSSSGTVSAYLGKSGGTISGHTKIASGWGSYKSVF